MYNRESSKVSPQKFNQTRVMSLNSAKKLALLLIILVLSACSRLEQPQATSLTPSAGPVIDLGTLAGGTSSSAIAINNLGQIVGTSNDATLTGNKQVIWSGGTVTAISAGNTNTVPALRQAINDSREIVSWINGGRAPTSGILSDAIYWNATGISSILPALAGGENRVFAYDINANGLIVGESRDATGVDKHAVIWNRTSLLRDLGLMGFGNSLVGNETSALGINDLGDVVGRALIGSNYQAFFWRNGVFTDLGPGVAIDVNNNGLVIGNTNPEVYAAWVWQNGVRTDLPALTGRPGNYVVSDLNNNGDIVGVGPGLVADTFGSSTAVLWRNGQAIELGNFPGGTFSSALGINDLGQIVGMGNLVAGGPMHALLWTGYTLNTAPTVTLAATSSTSIRAGGKVSFKGTFTDPDAGPWKYTFTWGNGSSSGSAATQGTVNASRTYTKSGRYQVTFKVTDAKGAVGTSRIIEVFVR
jgi:probable HAF family extracellular repeat protein